MSSLSFLFLRSFNQWPIRLATYLLLAWKEEEEEWKVSLSSFFVQPLPFFSPCPQERQKNHPLLPWSKPGIFIQLTPFPTLWLPHRFSFFVSPCRFFLYASFLFPLVFFFCSGSAKDLKLSPPSPVRGPLRGWWWLFLLPLFHGFQKWFSRKPLSLLLAHPAEYFFLRLGSRFWKLREGGIFD